MDMVLKKCRVGGASFGRVALLVIAVAAMCGGAGREARGATNIDPAATGSARYAWGENVGWVNLFGDANNGVLVHPDYLEGFAWTENLGWLNFGGGAPAGAGSHYTNTAPDQNTQPNFGINNDHAGHLWGYAWGENFGWVNFGADAASSLVTIDGGTGRFAGAAWGENVGWISFDGVPAGDVATAPTTAVPVKLTGVRFE